MQEYETIHTPHHKLTEKEGTDTHFSRRPKPTMVWCKHCKNDTNSTDAICAVCTVIGPSVHMRMIRSGELTQGHERLTKKH